jgi:hypothetical protein
MEPFFITHAAVTLHTRFFLSTQITDRYKYRLERDAMRVVLRICPDSSPNKPNYYYEAADLEHFTVYESNVRQGGKEFYIDHIYDQSCSQFDLYSAEIAPLVKDVVNSGRDCHLLLAGHPNGGRRYTFNGPTEYPGVLYRSLDGVFTSLGHTNSRVFFSCYQIDREVLKDCLQLNNGVSDGSIRLRDDPKKGVIVDRATVVQIRNVQAGLEAFGEASARMGTPNTDAHIIVNISVEKLVSEKKRTGMLTIILLGTVPIPSAFAEADQLAKNKVQWISHLNHCLDLLEARSPGIPFHKSKLTLQLREGLNGTKRSVLIDSLTPCVETYRTGINTLTLCTKIKTCTPSYEQVSKMTQRKPKPPEKDQSMQQTSRFLPVQAYSDRDVESEYKRLHQQYVQQQQALQQQQPLLNNSNGSFTLYPSSLIDFSSDQIMESMNMSTDSTFSRRSQPGTQSKSNTRPSTNNTSIIKSGLTPGKKRVKVENKPPQSRSTNSSPDLGSENLKKKNREVTLLRHENSQLSHRIKDLENKMVSQEKRQLHDSMQKMSPPPPSRVQNISIEESVIKRSASAGKQRQPVNKVTTPGKSAELDRYKEAMESSIKRMSEKIANLEQHNSQIVKEMAKKDQQITRFRLSSKDGSAGTVKQMERKQRDLAEQLDKANKRIDQLLGDKRTWDEQKAAMERQIQVLKQLSAATSSASSSLRIESVDQPEENHEDMPGSAASTLVMGDLEQDDVDDQSSNDQNEYQPYEFEPQETQQYYQYEGSDQYEYEDEEEEDEYHQNVQPQQPEYNADPMEPGDDQEEEYAQNEDVYTEEALMDDNDDKIKKLEFELSLTRQALAHALHTPQSNNTGGNFLRKNNIVPPFINNNN